MKFFTFFEALDSAEEVPSSPGGFFYKNFKVEDDEGTGNSLSFSMGISANAPTDGTFSVSKIFRMKKGESTGQPVYSFCKMDGRQRRAEVIEHLGDAYITVVCDRDRQLDEVYLMQDLLDGTFGTQKIGGKFYPRLLSGGMTLTERQKVKREIAEARGLTPVYTPGEQVLAEKEISVRQAAQAAEREASRTLADMKKKEEDERRGSKLAALLQRPKAQAFTADGGKRFGVPIETEGEDEVLADNTFCIRMQGGLPTEAYIFRKAPNGRVKRTNRTEVFQSYRVGVSKGVDVSVIDVVTVMLEDDVIEVSVVGSFEAIEVLRTEHGLNSGAIMGHYKDDVLVLYKVTKQKSEHVGTTMSS